MMTSGGYLAPTVLLMGLLVQSASAQPRDGTVPLTQVVMLGTGTPGPDPERSGPATAVVVNGTPYLIDFGPGVVRRAKAAAIDKGVRALEPINLRVVFATHLHSDHTVGYPDLILTPWVIGRRVPLEVYGPTGIKAMTQHILAAYEEDIKARTRPDGNQHGFSQGSWVNAHEIAPGIVYKIPKPLSWPASTPTASVFFWRGVRAILPKSRRGPPSLSSVPSCFAASIRHWCCVFPSSSIVQECKPIIARQSAASAPAPSEQRIPD